MVVDLIKLVMIDIYKVLKEGNYKIKMILQVYDELVFDVYKDEIEELKLIIEEKMKNVLKDLQVFIVVGIGFGENWLEVYQRVQFYNIE